jgi:hypothetical protein
MELSDFCLLDVCFGLLESAVELAGDSLFIELEFGSEIVCVDVLGIWG